MGKVNGSTYYAKLIVTIIKEENLNDRKQSNKLQM